jgi:peroxiredoxin
LEAGSSRTDAALKYASIDHVVVAMVADIFLCAAWNTVERGDIE